MQNTKYYDVIIIGSGVSGIAAARMLSKSQLSHVILEQCEFLGGRIQSWHYNKTHVDMGASYAHGIYGHALVDASKQIKCFCKLVQPSGGVTLDCATQKKVDKNLYSMVSELWDDIRNKMYAKSWKIYNKKMADISAKEAYDDLLQNDEDCASMYAHLSKVFGKDNVDRVLIGELSGLAGYYALNEDEVSVGGCMDPEEQHLKGGNHLINIGWNAVLKHLAKDLNILYKRKCVHVDYSKQNDAAVTVQFGDTSEVYHAKYVICTASIGILQRNLIQFTPALPQAKQDAIKNFTMGELDKAVIVFDKPFWNPGSYFLSIVQEDCTNRHFEFFMSVQPITKEPILVGFVHGRFAKEIGEMSDEQAQEVTLHQLRKMFGAELVNKSKVVAFTYSKWHLNEISYGSYSAVPKGFSGALYDDMKSTEGSNQTLFFAGEACNRKYPGTTHGAFVSGEDAAQAIMLINKPA